jgi:hypothetical protein
MSSCKGCFACTLTCKCAGEAAQRAPAALRLLFSPNEVGCCMTAAQRRTCLGVQSSAVDRQFCFFAFAPPGHAVTRLYVCCLLSMCFSTAVRVESALCRANACTRLAPVN